MAKRRRPTPTQVAHGIVYALIESYFEVGQPETDAEEKGIEADRVEKIRAVLERIRDHHDDRSGSSYGLNGVE